MTPDLDTPQEPIYIGTDALDAMTPSDGESFGAEFDYSDFDARR